MSSVIVSELNANPHQYAQQLSAGGTIESSQLTWLMLEDSDAWKSTFIARTNNA